MHLEEGLGVGVCGGNEECAWREKKALSSSYFF